MWPQVDVSTASRGWLTSKANGRSRRDFLVVAGIRSRLVALPLVDRVRHAVAIARVASGCDLSSPVFAVERIFGRRESALTELLNVRSCEGIVCHDLRCRSSSATFRARRNLKHSLVNSSRPHPRHATRRVAAPIAAFGTGTKHGSDTSQGLCG